MFNIKLVLLCQVDNIYCFTLFDIEDFTLFDIEEFYLFDIE